MNYDKAIEEKIRDYLRDSANPIIAAIENNNIHRAKEQATGWPDIEIDSTGFSAFGEVDQYGATSVHNVIITVGNHGSYSLEDKNDLKELTNEIVDEIGDYEKIIRYVNDNMFIKVYNFNIEYIEAQDEYEGFYGLASIRFQVQIRRI